MVQHREKEKASQAKQQNTATERRMLPEPLPIGAVVMIRSLTRHVKLRGPRFHGPYKVARVGKGGNYNLQTPSGQTLSRSYPIDHLRVVGEPAASNIWTQLTVDRVPPEDVIYRVDRLLDHRAHPAGGTEYRVRWEGFSPDFDSWEKVSNILSPDVIAQYWGLPYDDSDFAAFKPPVMLLLPEEIPHHGDEPTAGHAAPDPLAPHLPATMTDPGFARTP